jgi:hypothetical protein
MLMQPILIDDRPITALQLTNLKFRVSQPTRVNLHPPAKSFGNLYLPVAQASQVFDDHGVHLPKFAGNLEIA